MEDLALLMLVSYYYAPQVQENQVLAPNSIYICSSAYTKAKTH